MLLHITSDNQLFFFSLLTFPYDFQLFIIIYVNVNKDLGNTY
jgi:hypothetical protein